MHYYSTPNLSIMIAATKSIDICEWQSCALAQGKSLLCTLSCSYIWTYYSYVNNADSKIYAVWSVTNVLRYLSVAYFEINRWLFCSAVNKKKSLQGPLASNIPS